MIINDDLNVTLLDVVDYARKKGVYYSYGRNFSALSFRIDCHTVFSYKYGKVYSGNNTITLVPANVDYSSNTIDEKMIVIHFNLCNFITDKIQCFTPEKPQEFYSLFSEILEVWNEKKPGYKLAATAILYKILSRIKLLEYKNDKTDNKYEFAAEYLKRHMADTQLSIQHVAQKIGVCDSLFRREFKKKFGISPKQYLDNLRIEYAIMLMQSKYFSQNEICERCGYSDVKYFRTAFKNKTGTCMSKYKYNFVE